MLWFTVSKAFDKSGNKPQVTWIQIDIYIRFGAFLCRNIVGYKQVVQVLYSNGERVAIGR